MKRNLRSISYLPRKLLQSSLFNAKFLSSCILFLALFYLSGYAAANVLATCDNPELTDTTWEQIDNPDGVGWSSEKLRQACEYSQTIDTVAVVLIYRGKILYHWGKIDKKFKAHSIRNVFMKSGIFENPDNIAFGLRLNWRKENGIKNWT